MRPHDLTVRSLPGVLGAMQPLLVVALATAIALATPGVATSTSAASAPALRPATASDILKAVRAPGARAVVVNVWATWCVGCRQEHEVLLQIAAQDVVPLIGLNWKDDNAAARRWLAELGNPYSAVAEDRDGRVAIDWGVYGAPETFLISRDGTVLHKHVAPMTLEVWESEFLPLIDPDRRTAEAGS